MSKLLEQINTTKFRSTTVGGLVQEEVLFEPLDGNHGEIHPKSEDYVSEGVPFIMASDITDSGDLDLTKTKFISEEQANKLRKGFAKNGDILLSHKATIGRVAEVQTNRDFVVLTPQVTYYRVKNDKELTSKYLKYYFKTAYFQNTLKSFAGSGSTRAYLGIQAQYDLPIKLPDLPTQKKIASILSAYDAKIENNNLIIKKLETAAQTLFNEWFVNFRFPGYEKAKFVDSEMGKIPEGWNIRPLDEVANFLNGVASQKYPAANTEESLPVIKIREMNSGIDFNSDRATKKIEDKYIVKNGDILFSWSGSLSLMIWVGGDGVLNQHIFKVTSDKYPKWFVYQWNERHLQNFKLIAEGKATTMGHIQRHHLSESFVIVPNDNFLKKANKVMVNLFDQQILLQEENISLRSQRDQLLAKLI